MIHKRPLLLSACLTLLSTTSFANFVQEDEVLQDEDFDEEMTQREEIADVSMYSFIAEEYPQMPEMARKMHHFSVIGEMLYLKPYLGSMPWLYVADFSQFEQTTPSTTSQQISDRLKNLEMDFDFGFRVGIGYNTNWLKMENQLTWMSLHTQTSHTLAPLQAIDPNFTSPPLYVGLPVVYFPFWFDLGDNLFPYTLPPGQILSSQENSLFHWDQIDAVSKIPLSPLKRATFSPLLGVRGLISELKSEINDVYDTYGITLATQPPFNTTSTTLKQAFNAIGLVAGLDADINFGMGFHLTALFDTALVYGNMRTSTNFSSSVPVIPSTITPQYYHAFDQNYKFKPVIDLQTTLCWNRNIWKNKLALNMHLGYEVHYMPNFIEGIRVNDAGDTTYTYDLMLQGLNAGLGLSF